MATIRVEQPKDLPDPTPPSGSRFTKVLLAVGGGVLLVGITTLVVLLVTRPSTGPATTPPPTAAPSSAATVDGLVRSDQVWADGSGSTGTIGPAFVGYPQTPDGAAAAALSYVSAMGSPDILNDTVRHQVEEYIYTRENLPKARFDDETVAASRKTLGLDAEGKPTDPTRTVYSRTIPQYGAFKITQVEGNTRVTVKHWEPVIFGVGDKMSDLKIRWQLWQDVMVWEDDAWRIDSSDLDSDSPKPSDPSILWVSYAERAELLGADWVLVGDASEEPLPGLDLPKE